MNVERRLRPRFFAKGKSQSFGSARKAYDYLARREMASEFDHLKWYDLENEGDASPALQAYRRKWCERRADGSWQRTKEAKARLRSIIDRMMREDGVPHYDSELGRYWKPE